MSDWLVDGILESSRKALAEGQAILVQHTDELRAFIRSRIEFLQPAVGKEYVDECVEDWVKVYQEGSSIIRYKGDIRTDVNIWLPPHMFYAFQLMLEKSQKPKRKKK